MEEPRYRHQAAQFQQFPFDSLDVPTSASAATASSSLTSYGGGLPPPAMHSRRPRSGVCSNYWRRRPLSTLLVILACLTFVFYVLGPNIAVDNAQGGNINIPEQLPAVRMTTKSPPLFSLLLPLHLSRSDMAVGGVEESLSAVMKRVENLRKGGSLDVQLVVVGCFEGLGPISADVVLNACDVPLSQALDLAISSSSGTLLFVLPPLEQFLWDSSFKSGILSVEWAAEIAASFANDDSLGILGGCSVTPNGIITSCGIETAVGAGGKTIAYHRMEGASMRYYQCREPAEFLPGPPAPLLATPVVGAVIRRSALLTGAFDSSSCHNNNMLSDLNFCLSLLSYGFRAAVLPRWKVFSNHALGECSLQYSTGSGASTLVEKHLHDKHIFKRVGLTWDTYCGCTGLNIEAAGFLLPMEGQLEVSVIADKAEDCFCPGFLPYAGAALERMSSRSLAVGLSNLDHTIFVSHKSPKSYPRFPYDGLVYIEKRPEFVVGRSMTEVDPLPSLWTQRIMDDVDEVWVPSSWHQQQFLAAGVTANKVVVVPEPVDTCLFDPDGTTAIPLPDASASTFSFLSVFKLEDRKGWDILLRAYLQEFRMSENVVLVLHTYLYNSWNSRDKQTIMLKLRSVADSIGLAPAWDEGKLPTVSVISEELSMKDMPSLYASVDAFVLPSRGEGWGLPAAEAMSMGLPVIATNWSGLTMLLGDEWSYPLRVDQLEPVPVANAVEYGEIWALPSETELRRLMRHVFEHRDEAENKGKLAREFVVEHFDQQQVNLQVQAQLSRIIRSVGMPPPETFEEPLDKTDQMTDDFVGERLRNSLHGKDLILEPPPLPPDSLHAKDTEQLPTFSQAVEQVATAFEADYRVWPTTAEDQGLPGGPVNPQAAEDFAATADAVAQAAAALETGDHVWVQGEEDQGLPGGPLDPHAAKDLAAAADTVFKVVDALEATDHVVAAMGEDAGVPGGALDPEAAEDVANVAGAVDQAVKALEGDVHDWNEATEVQFPDGPLDPEAVEDFVEAANTVDEIIRAFETTDHVFPHEAEDEGLPVGPLNPEAARDLAEIADTVAQVVAAFEIDDHVWPVDAEDEGHPVGPLDPDAVGNFAAAAKTVAEAAGALEAADHLWATGDQDGLPVGPLDPDAAEDFADDFAQFTETVEQVVTTFEAADHVWPPEAEDEGLPVDPTHLYNRDSEDLKEGSEEVNSMPPEVALALEGLVDM